MRVVSGCGDDDDRTWRVVQDLYRRLVEHGVDQRRVRSLPDDDQIGVLLLGDLEHTPARRRHDDSHVALQSSRSERLTALVIDLVSHLREIDEQAHRRDAEPELAPSRDPDDGDDLVFR